MNFDENNKTAAAAAAAHAEWAKSRAVPDAVSLLQEAADRLAFAGFLEESDECHSLVKRLSKRQSIT